MAKRFSRGKTHRPAKKGVARRKNSTNRAIVLGTLTPIIVSLLWSIFIYHFILGNIFKDRVYDYGLNNRIYECIICFSGWFVYGIGFLIQSIHMKQANGRKNAAISSWYRKKVHWFMLGLSIAVPFVLTVLFGLMKDRNNNIRRFFGPDNIGVKLLLGTVVINIILWLIQRAYFFQKLRSTRL